MDRSGILRPEPDIFLATILGGTAPSGWTTTAVQLCFIGLASALAYLEEKGFVGLRVAPDTVLIDRHLHPRLIAWSNLSTSDSPTQVEPLKQVARMMRSAIRALPYEYEDLVNGDLADLLELCLDDNFTERPFEALFDALKDRRFWLSDVNESDVSSYVNALKMADRFHFDRFFDLPPAQRDVIEAKLDGPWPFEKGTPKDVLRTRVNSARDLWKGTAALPQDFRVAFQMFLSAAPAVRNFDGYAAITDASIGIPRWIKESASYKRAMAACHPLKASAFVDPCDPWNVPVDQHAKLTSTDPDDVTFVMESFAQGKNGFRQDAEAGYLHVKRLVARERAPPLLCLLAKCHEVGDGVIQNPERAAALYEEGGDAESAERCRAAAQAVAEELENLVEGPAALYRRAREDGGVLPCLAVGHGLLHGSAGFPLSQVHALAFYKRAAAVQGDVWSVIGDLYRKGIGLPRLFRKFVKCYHKSHRAGSRRGAWLDCFFRLHAEQVYDEGDEAFLKYIDNYFIENRNSFGCDDMLIPHLAAYFATMRHPFVNFSPRIAVKGKKKLPEPGAARRRRLPKSKFFRPRLVTTLSSWRPVAQGIADGAPRPRLVDRLCHVYAMGAALQFLSQKSLDYLSVRPEYAEVFAGSPPIPIFCAVDDIFPQRGKRPKLLPPAGDQTRHLAQFTEFLKRQLPEATDLPPDFASFAEALEYLHARLRLDLHRASPDLETARFHDFVLNVAEAPNWGCTERIESAQVAAAEAPDGSIEAQLAVASGYFYGDSGFPCNYEEAARFYRLAADNAGAERADLRADAERVFAHLTANGLGTRRDYGEAVAYFKRAIEHGSRQARVQFALFQEWAVRKLHRLDRTDADYQAMLADAVRQGDAEAQYQLGRLLESHDSEFIGRQEALEYYKAAGEQGHLGALRRWFLVLAKTADLQESQETEEAHRLDGEILEIAPVLSALGDDRVILRLVSVLERNERDSDAFTLLTIVKSTGKPFVLRHLADHLRRGRGTLQDVPRSIRIYKRIFVQDPVAASTLAELMIEEANGNLDRAKKMFNLAIIRTQGSPADWKLHLELRHEYAKFLDKNNEKEAGINILLALVKDDTSPDFFFEVATKLLMECGIDPSQRHAHGGAAEAPATTTRRGSVRRAHSIASVPTLGRLLAAHPGWKKKGWQFMRKAADGGNEQAALAFAYHLASQNRVHKAFEYYDIATKHADATVLIEFADFLGDHPAAAVHGREEEFQLRLRAYELGSEEQFAKLQEPVFKKAQYEHGNALYRAARRRDPGRTDETYGGGLAWIERAALNDDAEAKEKLATIRNEEMDRLIETSRKKRHHRS